MRQAAREFAEARVAPLVPAMERDDKFPPELVPAMGEAGLLGVTIPAAYGGSGLGHLARVLILEEIGAVSAAAAMALQVFHLGIEPVVLAGSQEQKQRLLPDLAAGKRSATAAVTEASGGSDPASLTTTCRRAERGGRKGWVLNGRKVFITNAHVADVQVVLARAEAEGGSGVAAGPAGGAPAAPAATAAAPLFNAFIVERGMEGFRPGREEHKVGLKGCNTGEVILEDCFVPEAALLGAEGDGLKVAMKAISEVGRSGMAGVGLGLIRACLDTAVAYAGKRQLYGKPLNRLPAIQDKLAEIALGLETSRLLTYRAAWLKDAGQRCDVQMAMAKYQTTEAAIQAAKLAAEVHGGYGYMAEYPTQRYLRDAQLLVPSAGTSDIMKVVIGRSLAR